MITKLIELATVALGLLINWAAKRENEAKKNEIEASRSSIVDNPGSEWLRRFNASGL